MAERVPVFLFCDLKDLLLFSNLIVVTNNSHVIALRPQHLLMDTQLVGLPDLVDFLIKRHLLALLLQWDLLMIILNLSALGHLLKLLLLLVELRLGVYNIENTIGYAAFVGDAAVGHFALWLDDLVVLGLRDEGILVLHVLAVDRLLGLHSRDDIASVDTLPEFLGKVRARDVVATVLLLTDIDRPSVSFGNRSLGRPRRLVQTLLVALNQVVELSLDSFLILLKERDRQVMIIIVRLSLQRSFIVSRVSL